MCQTLWTFILGFHSSPSWRFLAKSKCYDFHVWSIIQQYLHPTTWKVNRRSCLTVVDRVTCKQNPDVLLCHNHDTGQLLLYDFYGKLIRHVHIKDYNSGPFHTMYHYDAVDTIQVPPEQEEKIVIYSFASRLYDTHHIPHHMCIKVQIEDESQFQIINLLEYSPDSKNTQKHYITGMYFDEDHQHLFAIESKDNSFHPIIHVLKRDPVTQLMVHTHILEYEQIQVIIESYVKYWNWHKKQFWFHVRHHQSWACFTIPPFLLNEPITYDAPKSIRILGNDHCKIAYYLYLPGSHFTGFDRVVEYYKYYNAGHSGTCSSLIPYKNTYWNRNHNILWKSEQDVEKVYLSSKGLLLAVKSRGYESHCVNMSLYHLGPFSSSSCLKVRHES
jgi:hypothetical protein